MFPEQNICSFNAQYHRGFVNVGISYIFHQSRDARTFVRFRRRRSEGSYVLPSESPSIVSFVDGVQCAARSLPEIREKGGPAKNEYRRRCVKTNGFLPPRVRPPSCRRYTRMRKMHLLRILILRYDRELHCDTTEYARGHERKCPRRQKCITTGKDTSIYREPLSIFDLFRSTMSNWFILVESHVGWRLVLFATSFLTLFAPLRSSSSTSHTSLFYRTSISHYRAFVLFIFPGYLFSIFQSTSMNDGSSFSIKIERLSTERRCRAIAVMVFSAWWREVISCYRMLYCYDVPQRRTEDEGGGGAGKCFSVSRK